MHRSARSFWLPLWLAVVWLTPPASAVTIDWTTVGDPGNAADGSGFGSVSSAYQISKYEVTNAQYAEFLNAVATTDTNNLYNANMGSLSGGGIIQLGVSGAFTYLLVSGREDMPVNYVSFYDALRFANWLQNGQPTGGQTAATTENGAYTFSGPTSVGARNGTATIVLASADEWYKAAFYDAVSTSYFDYPAGSNTQAACTAPTAAANSANCDDPSSGNSTDADVDDLTAVGSFTGSASPYGTFDQGGNVWEWTEGSEVSGSFRVQRGGAYSFLPDQLDASIRRLGTPTDEVDFVGFRVAMVPEPDTALLVMIGLLTLARRGRRRASPRKCSLARVSSTHGGSEMKPLILFTVVLALASAPAFGQEVILTQVTNNEGQFGRAGEPWVVADPRAPQTVAVIWLETSDATGDPGSIGNLVGGPENCGIGRSTDGGRTWSIRRAPYRTNTVPAADVLSICGDPTGGVLPNGTIVFTAVQLGSPDWLQSISSFDSGLTWTAPTTPFGANQTLAAVLANRAVPDLGAGRQWTAVDPVTGEVSIQSQVDAPTTGRHMTVSTDGGASWSIPRNVGSTSLGPIGAAYGVVAGVYTSGGNQIFQTSTDHGMTWVRNVMPVGAGAGSGFGGPITAADPTARGRFAVLLSRGSATLEVWVTPDAGRTAALWTRTKVFTAATGESFAHPWIAYSPTGALGVRWRYVHADGTYDVDAVVSRDGGTNWGVPVRLTAARGPSPAGGLFLPGDDCACNLHLNETTLIATWADEFSGYRELWYASFDYTVP